MLKKIVSLLIVVVIVVSCFSFSANAEDIKKAEITVYYEGVKLIEDVAVDADGTVFVPMSWLTYFGLLECKENKNEYEFFYPEQSSLKQYAKRIFISKAEPYKLFVGYYFTNDGLAGELTVNNSSSSKAKKYSNSIQGQKRDGFNTIYSGSFSKGITIDGILYFPFEELFPLINAKVGVSNKGALCVSNNNSSVLKALYGTKIGEYIFDADDCIKVGKGFIDTTSWVTSTVLNLRFDRLDFIYKTGEVNDYQTIFEGMLLDDEAYLSTQDTKGGKSEVGLANDLLSGANTAVSALNKINISGENKDGIDTDILSEINSTLYSDSFLLDNIGTATKATGYVSDICNYWYIYNYQVDDHREMLGSVYDYISRKGIKDKSVYPSLTAAKSIQAQYDKTFSVATITKLGDVFFDKALSKVTDNKVTQKLFGSLLSSIEITRSILDWIDSTKKAMATMDAGVNVNYYDKIANTAYGVFTDVLCSQNCDDESLQRLRLSAILSLVASKNGFATEELFGDTYEDKIDDINEILRKLYLAADGTVCDSSSYYDKKKAELRKSVNKLVVTGIVGDNKNDIGIVKPPKDETSLVTTVLEQKIEYESDSGDNYLIFSIPEINLDSDYVNNLNETVYNDCSLIISDVQEELDEYGYPVASGGISYFYGANSNVLSLLICNKTSPYATPGSAYTVYNINIDSAQKASDEEVVATAGYTMDEFYDEVEVALGNEYISIYSNSGVYDSYRYDDFFAEQFDNTVSHSNVREVKPYIGEDGELYVVALVYSIAGAGAYYREVKVSGIDIHENYIEFTT